MGTLNELYLVQQARILIYTISHQWFISALEDITHKVAVPPFHCLPANEAEVIHMTNTLETDEE